MRRLEVAGGDLNSVCDVVFDLLRSSACTDFALVRTLKASCFDADRGEEYKTIPGGVGAQSLFGFFAHGLTDSFHLHHRAKLPRALVAN